MTEQIIINDLELFYKLAHQLDKDTFDEIYPLISKSREYSRRTLIDMLEFKRKNDNMTHEEIANQFKISKQYYSLWVSTRKAVPKNYVEAVSKYLEIDLKQAHKANDMRLSELNPEFYSPAIRELEKYRIENGMSTTQLAKKIGVTLGTYRNWIKKNKISTNKVNTVSIVTGIDASKLSNL